MSDLINETDEPFWIEGLRSEGGESLVLDEVVEDIVFVRHADPGDDTDERIRLDPGQRVVITSPRGCIAICLTDNDDEDDAIYWIRIVPVRREAGAIFGRSLRPGEPDDGRRVHVRPGERLELPAGSVQISLDAIEEFYRDLDPDRPHGLGAVLRVWLKVAGVEPPELARLALAAAHRLDAATHLLHRATSTGEFLHRQDRVGGPQLVAAVDEYVHLVQEVVVALARCIALIERGREAVSYPIPRTDTIDRHSAALKDIRDAYEHIDERAFGQARRHHDERNLMIFDHALLVREGLIAYFDHRLHVADLTDVIVASRQAIKALVGGPPTPDP